MNQFIFQLFYLFNFLLFISTASAKSIEYKSEKFNYEGYYLKAKKDSPTVLLIHDWDGLTEYEIKRANMLQKLGYSVFAVDLFGKGNRPTEDKDKRQHTGQLYSNRNKMRQIMKDSISTAKSLGLNTKNMVAIGYCFGGAAVLELARSGENLKAFFTFHGGLSTPDGQNYKNTKGQVIVYHGTADQAITMKDFGQLAEELESNHIPHEMISYGGAPHAFTVFESSRYQKVADEKSWAHFTGRLQQITQ